jgi:hypothetical protein
MGGWVGGNGAILVSVRSPVEELRDALGQSLRDGALGRLHRWRGGEAASADGPRSRLQWLRSGRATDALDEARSLRLVTPSAAAALEAHLARIRLEASMAPARDALDTVLEGDVHFSDARLPLREAVAQWPASPPPVRAALQAALARVAARATVPLSDAIAEASSGFGGSTHPDAGPPAAELLSIAEGALAASDGAADEAVAWLGAKDLAGLVHALRAADLDGLFSPRERWRRVAADVAGLGFERDLGARVRVEPAHRGITPRVRVAAPDPPRDVRLGPCDAEHGLVSELAAAEGLGRALALALTSPGLPVELRWPLDGTVPRALGTAFAQILTHRAGVRRMRDLAARECERVARLVASTILLETRACAASVVLLASVGVSERGRREGAPEVMRRALRVEVPPPLAVLVAGTPWGAPARLRGRLGGLAAWHALRERYDEDWYRNPRAEEVIRAGAQRGGGVSVEVWLGEDLGGRPGTDRMRLQELVAGQ